MGLLDRFKKPAAAGTAIDPVCKMDVDMAKPPGGTSAHGGTTYYFCAPGCKRSFEKDPHKFLGAHEH